MKPTGTIAERADRQWHGERRHNSWQRGFKNLLVQAGAVRLGTRLLLAGLLAAWPGLAQAQFTDTFDTLNPAWMTDRYEPAGFAVASFQGDNRLQITIDQTGSAANRPPIFSAAFSNTQGRYRLANIIGGWSLSAEVYISSAFDTSTGQLVRSDLWAHTGTTPAGGDYAVMGFTNASPTDPLNPTAPDRALHFQVFDNNSGAWFDLGLPADFVPDAWYTLSERLVGTNFEFSIDGNLVQTNPTVAGSDLLSGAVEAYNFGQTDANGLNSYSVYWDNVAAVPEPATFGLAGGALALGLGWVRRRNLRRSK